MREGVANNLRLLEHLQATDANSIDRVNRQMRCDAVLTLLHLRRLIDEKIQSLSMDDPHDWRAVNPQEIAPGFLADAKELMDSVLYRDFWSDWAHKHDRMWAVSCRTDRAEVLFQFLKSIESQDESISVS